jgi:hypothetical protein
MRWARPGRSGARRLIFDCQRAETLSLRAKRSNPLIRLRRHGLLRRFAPRNDVETNALIPAAHFARVVQILCPSPIRGRRESRATTAPVAPCAKGEHTGWNYRFSRNAPAFPAQWCYGFLRALPGERPLLPPSPAWDLPRGLTPGSRRQDHTTSPSAAEPFAVEPAASIASRAQRNVTMAIRPSGGHGMASVLHHNSILINRNIFHRGTGQPKSA